MNHFSYPLTIVQINIFEEPQNIFSQPKKNYPRLLSQPPVFLTVECPPGFNVWSGRFEIFAATDIDRNQNNATFNVKTIYLNKKILVLIIKE